MVRCALFPEYRSCDNTALTFNVTWNCPVKCNYCYRAKSHSHEDPIILNTEDLIRVADDASRYGVNEYRISGGEPMSIGEKLFDYAEIIHDRTGKKPILMTSGHLIDDRWLQSASNKFAAIAISIDNPIETKKSHKCLSIVKSNTSDELPLTYGLTLISNEHFSNIVQVFDLMYKNVDFQFMPQLDYPCLSYSPPPSHEQLGILREQTKILFNNYGVIPYYFVYLIGSLLWLKSASQRFVLNLHPEGNFQIYDSLIDRWRVEYQWKNYILKQQENSAICQRCSWLASCKHHPLWDLRYDWCSLRKSVFEGIYEGLGVN